jgi:hypothetical protein
VPLAIILRVRGPESTAAPELLGLVLGIADAAIAWVLCDLWCAVGELQHLLLGHLLPFPLLGADGLAAARLRWLVQ